MSREKFLADLKVHFDAAPAAEIAALRERVVWLGKRHPNLVAIAHAKGITKDPKYFDPDCTTETGAIGVDDAKLLYALVSLVRPDWVVEVGTWFGTSAAVMTIAGAKVRTCDRNNVFVEGISTEGAVIYRKCMGTKLLRGLVHNKWKCRFAFIDANLKVPDAPLLRKVLVPGSPIALHDFEGDMKGVRNYQLLRHNFKELELVRLVELPVKDTSLAVMIPRGWR